MLCGLNGVASFACGVLTARSEVSQGVLRKQPIMAGIPDDRSADGRRSAQASACAAAAAKRNYRDVFLNGRTRLRKESTEQTEITVQTEEDLERSLEIHVYSATSVSSILSLCSLNPLT
jgi:hypothetical protein